MDTTSGLGQESGMRRFRMVVLGMASMVVAFGLVTWDALEGREVVVHTDVYAVKTIL